MTKTSISGTTPLAHTFNGQTLRHVILDGEPWFHAADALRCLGHPTAHGTTNYVRKLDADEKKKLQRRGYPELDAGKGSPTLTVVAESGLFTLIMRSDSPQAKPFQQWVTREVLPSIRRTGGYLLNEHARATAHADAKEAMPQTRRKPPIVNKPTPSEWGNPTPRSD